MSDQAWEAQQYTRPMWSWPPWALPCGLVRWAPSLTSLLNSSPSRSHNFWNSNKISSVQFSCSVISDSLRPHGLQHARPPCPSPTPGVYPNSCPLSRWCHPTISSSVISFSSHLQSFPASGSFPMSQFFTSGGQSIAVSASTSVFPMNTQDGSPLGWTGWISMSFLKKCITYN